MSSMYESRWNLLWCEYVFRQVDYSVAQNTLQFNINWLGVPTFEDAVSSYFNENQCGKKRFSYLYHKVLKCKKTSEKRKFDCVSTIKSVWIKVFDMDDYVMQQYVEHCNKDMNTKYIDISKVSCSINGQDPFAAERKKIKETQERVIRVDENNFPIYDEYYPGEDYCVWNYEVNGLQISLVTILVIVAICLILFILIFIYAQKHRSEKRNALNRTLDIGLVDEHESCVCDKQPTCRS